MRPRRLDDQPAAKARGVRPVMMGLGADALREAAVALAGEVDHATADRMFNVMFDPESARADALVVVARWIRSRRG